MPLAKISSWRLSNRVAYKKCVVIWKYLHEEFIFLLTFFLIVPKHHCVPNCQFDTTLEKSSFQMQDRTARLFYKKVWYKKVNMKWPKSMRLLQKINISLLYFSLKGQFGQKKLAFSVIRLVETLFLHANFRFFRFWSSKKQCFSQAVYVNISTGNNWQSYPFKVKLSKIKKVK